MPCLPANAIRFPSRQLQPSFLALLTMLLFAGTALAQPVITSLTPSTAVPGAAVTIIGEGFNATMASNVVYVGQVRATVTAVSIGGGMGDDTLTLTVPTGAAYGRVSVVNTGTGLGDVSRQFFLPTFTPALGRALRTSDFVASMISNQATAYALTPVDLNADGKLDLVVTTYAGDNITYRLNTSTIGSLSFGAETNINVPGFAGMQDNEVGDIDGDGLMDIIAVSEAADKFVVLRRTGALTFAQTPFDTGDEPQSLALIDADNDGKLDIAVGYNVGGVQLYRNTTVGTTVSFDAGVSFTSGVTGALSMTVADYNDDGNDDILAARNASNLAKIFENTSSGVGNVNFSTTAEIDTGTNSFPNYITAGELDGDGKIDAVIPFAHATRTNAGLAANTSAANVEFNLASLTGVGGSQDTAALGDLTGDGKPDLILPMNVNFGSGEYRTAVFTNGSSSGTISFPAKIELSATGGAGPRNSAIADFDGDNRPDLLVYHTNTGNISLFRNTPVQTPSTQATSVSAPSTTLLPTSASLSWTRGSGQRVVVFMKQTSSTSDVPAPVDLSTYSASSTFGVGTQIGSSGWYAVATGTGTSATISGLTQNTAYRVMVVEYNNNAVSGAEAYQTATAADNPLNFTTPVPVSIISLARADASPTNASTVPYELTLGDDVVAGLTAVRFNLTVTGTIAGASITSVTGSGSSYTVNVGTGTGSGNITLNFNNATNIVPGISTTLPFAGHTYVIDRTVPTLTPVTLASDNADETKATVGDKVTLGFTASETIEPPTVSIAGHAVTATNVAGHEWTASYVMTSSETEGAVAFDIAFSDAAGNAGTVVTTTTDTSAVIFAHPVAEIPVIEGKVSNVDLTGPVFIAPDAVVSGGKLTGEIYSQGTLTGNITLGPGTTIHGGIVAGNISGPRLWPAVLLGVTVAANTRLQHVIVGAGTTLSPTVVIGAGVRFENQQLIPAGLDLTGALDSRIWTGGAALTSVDLHGAVLRFPTHSILQALRLLPDLGELDQNANGELVLATDAFTGTLLPVQVRQAAAGTAAGVYIDDAGNVVFVTGAGLEVVAYPLVVADELFSAALAQQNLSSAYDAQGRLNVTSSLPQSHFLARPRAGAVPAFRSEQPGLLLYTLERPAGATGYSLIFENENGEMMEQELVPVPADWPLLRDALLTIPGASNAGIDAAGVISLQRNGRVIQGRVSYQVVRGTAGAAPPAEITLQPTVDLNGDGSLDYQLVYPNGDVQALLIYP